jgi:hypothetical protein
MSSLPRRPHQSGTVLTWATGPQAAVLLGARHRSLAAADLALGQPEYRMPDRLAAGSPDHRCSAADLDPAMRAASA